MCIHYYNNNNNVNYFYRIIANSRTTSLFSSWFVIVVEPNEPWSQMNIFISFFLFTYNSFFVWIFISFRFFFYILYFLLDQFSISSVLQYKSLIWEHFLIPSFRLFYFLFRFSVFADANIRRSYSSIHVRNDIRIKCKSIQL